MGKICSVEGCDNKYSCKGYCDKHYRRVRLYGDPHTVLTNHRKYDPICTVDGCNNSHRIKGYCDKHYSKIRKYGDPLGYTYAPSPEDGICTLEGCNKEYKALGFCSKHYGRMYRKGTLSTHWTSWPPEKRFFAQVEKTDSCWHWTGQFTVNGYGKLRVGGKLVAAHRFSYSTAHPEEPINVAKRGTTCIDHICNNKACVNPAHLRVIDQKLNSARGLIQSAMSKGIEVIPILEELLKEATSENCQ